MMADAPTPNDLRNYWVDTGLGRTVFAAENKQPNVLMIHGFKRSARQLLRWRNFIPELGFVSLPGHGGAPKLSEVSISAWTAALREMIEVAFPTPPLIIGESLGAIVAMSLPARAVVAVEPLLSTDNLWPLTRTIQRGKARGVEILQEDVALFDTPFTWVLDRISAPTLVLAGLEPLLPERDVHPEPSLLTDEDFAAYAAHPLVEAYRIPGGHTLLDHNHAGVLGVAAPFMLRHGYFGPQP